MLPVSLMKKAVKHEDRMNEGEWISFSNIKFVCSNSVLSSGSSYGLVDRAAKLVYLVKKTYDVYVHTCTQKR